MLTNAQRREVNRLLEERAGHLEHARTMMASAQGEDRSLRASEQREFDQALAKAEELGQRAKRLEQFYAAGDEPTGRINPNGPDGGRGEARTLGGWLAGEFRALGEGSGPGSYIVPSEHAGTFWDRLRPQSVMLQAGIKVIETTSDELHIPLVTSDVGASWVAEGTAITASDPGVTEVVATPRKLAALVVMSNELIADSNPSVLELVVDNLTKTMALALDSGMLEGDGVAPTIQGLRATTGIQEVSLGANGAALTDLDPIADALGLLAAENANGPYAIVMHARSWNVLAKVKEETGSTKPLLVDETVVDGIPRRAIYGVPVFLTSQLSVAETQGEASNASSAYVFDTTQVVAVRRSEVRIEQDPYRLFNTDQTELRAVSRWDLVVPNPKAVVRVKGIVP